MRGVVVRDLDHELVVLLLQISQRRRPPADPRLRCDNTAWQLVPQTVELLEQIARRPGRLERRAWQ